MLEIVITTREESSDAVADRLMEFGAGGVWLESSVSAKEVGQDLFASDIVMEEENRGGEVTIKGYLPLSFLIEPLEKFLKRLPSFGLPQAALQWREIEGEEWSQKWREHWQPVPAGKRLLIVPAWLSLSPLGGRIPLLLDPGPAFGTGDHDTTCLCLEMLEETISGGEDVLDLGCGSGILSLAACLLGAKKACGVDYDPLAVAQSLSNARLNSIVKADFSVADLREGASWDKLTPSQVVVANLTADLLSAFAPRLPELIAPGGCLLASGIYMGRLEEVLTAFKKAGLNPIAVRNKGQWRALRLGRDER